MRSGGSLGSWDWRRIVATTFPLLIVLSVVVLWAGLTLEGAEEMLDDFAILAVMVPTMVDMGGNLGAIMSSRLSTRLHLGTAELDPRDGVLWANVLAILALAASIFTALAVGAFLLGQVVGSSLGLGTLLFISLSSGMSVAVLAVVLSIVTTYVSYRAGINPDDTTIPIVTNVVDVFGMLVFIGVSSWVLAT
jgi:mgtE-like transporter